MRPGAGTCTEWSKRDRTRSPPRERSWALMNTLIAILALGASLLGGGAPRPRLRAGKSPAAMETTDPHVRTGTWCRPAGQARLKSRRPGRDFLRSPSSASATSDEATAIERPQGRLASVRSTPAAARSQEVEIKPRQEVIRTGAGAAANSPGCVVGNRCQHGSAARLIAFRQDRHLPPRGLLITAGGRWPADTSVRPFGWSPWRCRESSCSARVGSRGCSEADHAAPLIPVSGPRACARPTPGAETFSCH